MNIILKEVIPEDRTEYLEEYHRLLDETAGVVQDRKTGEQWQKVNVIVAIVTKPIPG